MVAGGTGMEELRQGRKEEARQRASVRVDDTPEY